MTPKITLYLLCILCFLVVNNSLSAQKDYQPAYIISLQGDSIQGFLDYRNWSINPKEINFKTSENGAIKTYAPIEIKAFGIASDHYISAVVEREISSTNISQLKQSPDFNLQLDTCFLQVIYSGEKSLYFHKHNTAKENFYINEDGKIELLKYKKYLKDVNKIKENKSYIAQLMNYLDKEPEIAALASNTSYNRKSLSRLFAAYYTATNKSIDYIKKKEPITSKFGITLGLRSTGFTFSSSSPDFFNAAIQHNEDRSNKISAGVTLELVLPRMQKKLSIYNELIYSSYNTKSTSRQIEHDSLYYDLSSELGLTYIRLNNLIRYSYPLKSMKIFANVGVANAIAIQTKNELTTVKTFYTQVTTEDSNLIDDIRKHEQAFLLGAGMNIKNMGFELRYEQGNGTSPFTGLKSLTKTFNFLLSYRF